MPKPVNDRTKVLSVLYAIAPDFPEVVYRAEIKQGAYGWSIEIEGDRAGSMQRLATRLGWMGDPPKVTGDAHHIRTVWTLHNRRVQVTVVALETLIARVPGQRPADSGTLFPGG